MAVVRIHHYQVDSADTEELLARRATLVSAIRAAHPGLAEARLTRLDDGSYTDAWRWDRPEQMVAAFEDAASFPEIGAAMALTRDATAQTGVVVDER